MRALGRAPPPPASPLLSLLRCFSTARPGQPSSLHLARVTASSAAPAPRALREAEAERMGRAWSLRAACAEDEPAQSVRLTVPRSAHDFATARAAFRRGLGAVRRGYAAEWEARRAAEAAGAAAAGAATAALKAERDAVRAVQRRVALAAQAARVQAQGAARAARRAVAASRASQGQAQLAELRSAWLAELEEDARGWVPEARIDELITPALFSQKFGWQWEGWFSGKELKRQLREDARRTRRAGEPLREVQLPPSLQAYAEDWESGGEEAGGGGGGAAGARAPPTPAQAPASREAARHASPAIAQALEAAREAARARGTLLPEPAYDADGQPLPEPDSALDIAALRVRQAAREGSVSLAELAQGRGLESVLAEYEAWLEGQAREVEDVLAREGAAAAEAAAAEEAAAAAAAAAEAEAAGLGGGVGGGSGSSSGSGSARAGAGAPEEAAEGWVAADAAAAAAAAPAGPEAQIAPSAASRLAAAAAAASSSGALSSVALGLRDAATGRVIVDDGERATENAYIAACLNAGNVEALYYALLRKRARLARRTAYATALAGFEGKWGAWVRNIEARGGVGGAVSGLSGEEQQ